MKAARSGQARALAQEQRVPAGSSRPASVTRMSRGGAAPRRAPDQLRPAAEAERAVVEPQSREHLGATMLSDIAELARRGTSEDLAAKGSPAAQDFAPRAP
eukprot:2082151-Pyramimonas_sp.AAC.1